MRRNNHLAQMILAAFILLSLFAIAANAQDSMPWDGKNKDAAVWTQYLKLQIPNLGKDLLATTPKDVSYFCPKFPGLSKDQKIDFYSHMLAKMAQFESNFKPETTYTEAFNDAKGKKIISRGLLQLSIESANGYGCEFREAAEIHDPLKNLGCSIRILNRWIVRDGTIAGRNSGSWRGSARYWSTMRELPGKKSFIEIRKHLNGLSYCR